MKRDECMDTYFVARGLRVRQEPAVATLRQLFELPWHIVSGLARLLYRWQERIDTRAHMRELDDRLFADIGLSKADVAGEVEKPFWQD